MGLYPFHIQPPLLLSNGNWTVSCHIPLHRKRKSGLIAISLEIPQISQGASDAFADFGLTVHLLLEQANDPLAICTSQAVRLNHQFANPDVVHRLRRARLSDSCAGQERGYEKSEQDAHSTSRWELEPLDESFRRRHHRTDLDRTANGPRLG